MAWSFNNELYEQIDGVSMSESLAPVLANIIMAECEKIMVNKLLKEKVIMFNARYVDDTLLMIKERDVMFIISLIILIRTWNLPSTHLTPVSHIFLI